MNIFFKQAVRKPVFTILMGFLLGFSAAITCTGYSAWISAQMQQRVISGGYTTIAIPIEPDFDKMSAEEIATAMQNRIFADQAGQHRRAMHKNQAGV